MLAIRVDYVSWPGYGEQEDAEYVEVSGEDQASFTKVLTARLYPESEHARHIVVRLPDTDAWAFAPIDPELTMREAHAFAGGEVLEISRVGRGGSLIATFAEGIGRAHSGRCPGTTPTRRQ